MLRDFVYAARNLRSSPAFALTSVLTLALGAGAITGIFSVAEAVILRPLPYKDPGRLRRAAISRATTGRRRKSYRRR